MQFLQQRPSVTLADHTNRKHGTFAAEMFVGRPSFDAMLGFKDWATTLQASLEELLARKACPIKTIAIVLDRAGAWVVVTTKVCVQVGDARSAVDTVLKKLPVPLRNAILSSVRAFDELDKTRVDEWVPAWLPKAAEAPSTPKEGMSLRDFLAQEEEEPCEPRPAALALTDLDAEASEDICPCAVDREIWREGLKNTATVIVAHAGQEDAPALTYIRCHRETRRVELLAKRISRSASLVDCVRTARRMAEEGSLPGHTGPRARKTEFLRCCSEALAKACPRAVNDPKMLAPRQAWELAMEMGDGDARACDHCGRPATNPVRAEDIVDGCELETFLQLHESVRDKVYCGGVGAEVATVVYCADCGRDDVLADAPEQTLRTYGAKRRRCTRCDTHAVALRSMRRRTATILATVPGPRDTATNRIYY